MPAVDRTEGPSSPAYQPDPDADAYENGDTSTWAEDPHSPMSPESPPPAMPGNLTTDKLDHPATSNFQKKPETPAKATAEGGGGGKQAAEQSLKKMAEARAAIALRVAAALMPKASAHEVELKAVDLMDLDESQLRATAATLNVFAGKTGGEEEVEEEEEEVIDEKMGGKKAAIEITARIDKLEQSFGRLVKAMSHFFGGEEIEEKEVSESELMAYLMGQDQDGDGIDQSKNDFPQDYDVEKMAEGERAKGEESEGAKLFDEGKMSTDEMEEEAMLRAMLEEMDDEMGMTASAATDASEPLAKGQGIQSGEGGNVNPDAAAKTPQVAQADGKDKTAADDSGFAENDIEITAGTDPMGLMDIDKEASADDELAQLYADLDLPKTAGEEEEEEADDDAGTDEEAEKDDEEFGADDEGKKGGKKAATEPKFKPQPKTASSGAQRPGAVPSSGMPKAARDEIAELEKMWESAPDVSSVFGMNQR
jgi:hypothetical protein